MNRLNLFKSEKNKKTYSKRNDKIAVQMKETLSTAFLRGDLYDLPCSSLTVSHVELSADLRNAKIYVMPLGEENKEKIIPFLEQKKHFFKNLMATKMKLKYIPEIIFKLDNSFDYSQKIESLLNSHGSHQDCNNL